MQRISLRLSALVALTITCQDGAGESQLLGAAKSRFRDQRTPDERLVVGTEVPRGKYPWVVALVYSGDSNNFRAQFCGGSLIASKFVITAAHCVDQGTPPHEVEIFYAETDLQSAGSRMKLRAIEVSPRWNPYTKVGDIAVLTLQQDIPTSTIASIGSNGDPNVPRHNEEILVAGWGMRSFGGAKSPALLEAQAKALPSEKCNDAEAYGSDFKGSDMICAGTVRLGANVCSGDSGGPLVAVRAGVPLLVGVVSWGDGCSDAKKWGVFSRVSTYSDWLQKVMLRESGPP